MKDTQTAKHDDERDRGAEHPDLVLKGEEEHPLWSPFLEIELDDKLQITRISWIDP